MNFLPNDIFAMSSAHECMSKAILQAMSSAMPVIASPCEGAEELISDNGTTFQQSSAGLLAEALTSLHRNKKKLESMVRSSRHRVSQFTWEVAAESYRAEYRGILSARAPASD